SVIFGSGGIGVVSGTGVGGAGVVLAGEVLVGGGGGIGRATGGFFPPHALTPSAATSVATTANCICLICLRSLSLNSLPRLAPRTSRLATATSSGTYCSPRA